MMHGQKNIKLLK